MMGPAAAGIGLLHFSTLIISAPSVSWSGSVKDTDYGTAKRFKIASKNFEHMLNVMIGLAEESGSAKFISPAEYHYVGKCEVSKTCRSVANVTLGAKSVVSVYSEKLNLRLAKHAQMIKLLKDLTIKAQHTKDKTLNKRIKSLQQKLEEFKRKSREITELHSRARIISDLVTKLAMKCRTLEYASSGLVELDEILEPVISLQDSFVETEKFMNVEAGTAKSLKAIQRLKAVVPGVKVLSIAAVNVASRRMTLEDIAKLNLGTDDCISRL